MNKKYDRQIRLWHETGQASLENAKVCLISANWAGIEFLKNLVLGGIQHFTIYDDEKISQQDFWFIKDQVGLKRAENAAKRITEFNSDAAYEFKENFSSFEEFSAFTIVCFSCPLQQKHKDLLQYCYDRNIKCIVLRDIGYYAKIDIYCKLHLVLDPHMDNEIKDLRIIDPIEGIPHPEFDNLDSHDHAHVPWLVILIEALRRWNRALPVSRTDKDEFKHLINSMRHGNEELNFDEAIANAYRAWTEVKISADLLEIFECDGFDLDTKSIFSGIKEFYNRFGVLPLNGSIPDMHSDSRSYMELTKLYREKANMDALAVFEFAKQFSSNVDFGVVQNLCRNCNHLRLIRNQRPVSDGTGIAGLIEEFDEFKIQNGTLPMDQSQFELFDSDLLKDLTRYNGQSIASVSSIVGGVGAQEAIKLITQQFVPGKARTVLNFHGNPTIISE